ncbi:PH, RCC1 and FYVE domains-containing protein 1 isoform X3 [Olea europaea var. sylvestris]|uniref:PH, RCC1 and FYVE domains-containing protein 1 isoform X3 n=1 Tax=Olea europaea var. sylvestris TaxID=158386 RepID=UPI000C1D7B51|nr:PH, RCC1 and FYVE domains-containing protein 1 isoform X3 [Olea europaea var. sylvestris]
MTDQQGSSPGERNAEQAITALKRGSYLLKYGRRGKPKFCHFQLSKDETTIIWYPGRKEKQLRLSQVSRIIPGQRTQICKDKDEAEIWFVALKALTSQGNFQKWRTGIGIDSMSSDNSRTLTGRNSESILSSSSCDTKNEDRLHCQIVPIPFERPPQKRPGRVFSDFLLYNAAGQCSRQIEFVTSSHSPQPQENVGDLNGKISTDTSRVSFSSAISSSCSVGSSLEDNVTSSDIFIWGEGTEDGLLGGGVHGIGGSVFPRKDAFLPMVLESNLVLDAQNIACGNEHAVLITRQGEIFSWGVGSGGLLGHGVEADVSSPKLINTLSGLNIVSIACGEYHTCAVTLSGDLYTWGDGIHNFGLLGHGTEVSHWTPRKIRGQMEGIHVISVSCGPWHSAAIASGGELFTFGDGTFGALGHGDRCSTNVPMEVETLKGLRVINVSCGFWHTAAIIEVPCESSSSNVSSTRKLFTWGNGDEGQLGHGDKLSRLVPCCVSVSTDTNFCQVACGHSITVCLTTCGQIYAMGSADCSQLESPRDAGTLPLRIEGKIKNSFIEEISCGSHHVVALTSKSEVFTWGKGRNGQLGHGDNADRNTPTLVEALKDKLVKRVICGNNFTAAICHHKRIFVADRSSCSSCDKSFNFRRKRHNCYNCGLVFCSTCSNEKSFKASFAPNRKKPYRVCEGCFRKLNKGLDLSSRPPKASCGKVCGDLGKIKEKESSKAKSRGLLSRLSFFDSFRLSDSGLSKKNQKLHSSSNHNSHFHSRSFEWNGSHASSPSTSIFDYCEKINASLPGSARHSIASSPLSANSSPYHSISLASSFASVPSEEEIDDSNQRNDNLAEEISVLREQVEALTHRTQFLAAELERTSDQLEEAMEFVQDEAEKNNAAKEVIKCLVRQLKAMAVRLPQGSSCRATDPFADNMSHVLSTAST